MEEQYIKGYVLATFFENPENYYKVVLIQIEETDLDYGEAEIVITGTMGDLQEDTLYHFVGHETRHPKYGQQFQVDRYKKDAPSSKEALVQYLSGKQFKGIGPKTAEKIVDKLGPNAIEKILEDPENLNGIPGLNQEKKDNLVKNLKDEQGMTHIIVTLNHYGLSNQMAYQIYRAYGSLAIEKIEENPYRLMAEIPRVSFRQADELAENMGIEADSPFRIRAALLYALSRLVVSQGDTFVEEGDLVEAARTLLESARQFLITEDLLKEGLGEAVSTGSILEEEGRYYLPVYYHAEIAIADRLKDLLDREDFKYTESEVEEAIQRVEDREGMTYGPSQKSAIIQAVNAPVSLLTGGPGTGKTTVVNGIIQVLADLKGLNMDPHSYKEGEAYPFRLAAPTGRAAKRMTETTQLPASTIHRLLGLTGLEEETWNEDSEPVSGQLLIIDEMSMVDTWLFDRLLAAVDDDLQILLVGDKDQLPSVGPGQVFQDLITSGQVPVAELTEIYRQEEGSTIPYLAQSVRKGALPADFMDNQKDRSFFSCKQNQVLDLVKVVVERALEKGYSDLDIQVLAPMYKGPAGIDALNKQLQDIFNPKKDAKTKEVQVGNHVFRVGDKVIQLVNEADKNVFNGDLGKIVSIIDGKYTDSENDEIVISFDGQELTYERPDWNKFTLAYCMSIHKSQGSEFPIVILPMVMGYRRMLQNNLLYTAITRASQSLILLGDVRAFQMAARNNQNNRKTTLALRLKEEEEVVETSSDQTYILDAAIISSGRVNPMIGMEGINPYDL